MARRKLKPSAHPDGDGRPVTQFTQEQIDYCSIWLGKVQFTSRVVVMLCQKWPEISREMALELIRVTRARVFAEMRSRGEDDPLTAIYLYLKSVVANEETEERHRLAAANQIVRLFGLERLAKAIEGAGGVEEFLAGVYARRLASGSVSRPGVPDGTGNGNQVETGESS